jgi:hypothetical protein
MPNPNPSTQPQQFPAGGFLEPLLQADTAARSAVNLLTGGWANNIESANAALFDRSPGDWLTHYKAQLQSHLARDAFDATHRPIAVALGDGLGVAAMARAGYLAGARGSAALPSVAKGQLGEGLSVAKTVLQGDRPVGFQVRKIMQNNKATVIDHETAKGLYVESKFGPKAKLSPNQQYAQQQWGSGYRVDHWLPEHVGWITAPLASAVGGLLSWGMHTLNTPHNDDTPSGSAPADDTTSDDSSQDDDAPDGGYDGYQDDEADNPTTN